jgi:hypothetical protein
MSQVSQQGESGDEDRADGQDDVSWVGAQHLMHGYCGRASESRDAQLASPPVPEARPVAVVRTKPRQARVVRIGPPRSTPGAATTTTTTKPVDAA